MGQSNLSISIGISYISCFLINVNTATEIRFKRNIGLIFPPEASIELISSISIPGQNLPEEQSVNVGTEFRFHYILPENASEVADDLPEVSERLRERRHELILEESELRAQIYESIEKAIEWRGFPGRECLLRLICEYSASPIVYSQGIFGQFLNILLKPSSTPAEILSNEILMAEYFGTQAAHQLNLSLCQKKYHECEISILDIFTKSID